MNAPAGKRSRWPLYVGAVIVGLILLLALLRHLMQPEYLSATLLRQAEAASGLNLRLSSPADVSLWPDLNIVMRGLEARSEVGARPLLTAERVELALPWSSLWGGEVEIQAMRLQRPRLDRDALTVWLNAQPTAAGPARPLQLPRLSAELRVDDGSVVGRGRGAWRIESVQLQLSRLMPGEDFRLALGFEHLDGDLQLPLSLEASGRMHGSGMPIDLSPLALRLGGEGEAELLRLNGQLELDHPHRLGFALVGRSRHWPQHWPALPVDYAQGNGAASTPSEIELSAEFRGSPDLVGPLRLTVRRGSFDSRFEAEASQFLAWLAQPGAGLLPPLRGEATLPLLESGSLRIEGLRIELVEDADGG